MERVWLVSNPGSGSAKVATLAAIEGALAGLDIAVVGRTGFPAEPLPDAAALDAAGADTVVVFAGDGTINAVTCALDDWPGACLPLPGGTMNMLPHQLHGPAASAADIVRAAATVQAVAMPQVICGSHRALCGIIAGPAASWVHAREALRQGRRWRAVWRAAKFAWLKGFRRGLRVIGPGTPDARHRAVLLFPKHDGIEVAAIAAWKWRDVAVLGVHALAGHWRDADTVNLATVPALALGGARSSALLFDGEASYMKLPVRLSHGWTRLEVPHHRSARIAHFADPVSRLRRPLRRRGYARTRRLRRRGRLRPARRGGVHRRHDHGGPAERVRGCRALAGRLARARHAVPRQPRSTGVPAVAAPADALRPFRRAAGAGDQAPRGAGRHPRPAAHRHPRAVAARLVQGRGAARQPGRRARRCPRGPAGEPDHRRRAPSAGRRPRLHRARPHPGRAGGAPAR